jgi:Predicted RNA binding protein (contains ribosomal protein S1 domain)
MQEFKNGEIIEGIVTSIKKYGVFLSFEYGYVGLLHISEISTKYIANIFNYFEIGDTIKVVVKTIDLDSKYLGVSIKALPDELNPYFNKDKSKKVVGYIKDIDFTKLDKALPKMVEVELQREKERT